MPEKTLYQQFEKKTDKAPELESQQMKIKLFPEDEDNKKTAGFLNNRWQKMDDTSRS